MRTSEKNIMCYAYVLKRITRPFEANIYLLRQMSNGYQERTTQKKKETKRKKPTLYVENRTKTMKKAM